VSVAGYFIPRPVLLAVGLVVAALLGVVLWLTITGGSSTNTATILTPVPHPRSTKRHLVAPTLHGYVAEVSGVVQRVVCPAKAQSVTSCQTKPLARARVLFLTARPPDQGKKLYAATDDKGRYRLRLRSNTYTVSIVGRHSPVTTIRLLPTEARALPPIIVPAGK
jgi:hypothetical protein